MEKKIYTKNYAKLAIALLLILLIQVMLPICSNVTFAATVTSSGLKYVVEGGNVYITGYNTKLGKSVTIPSSIQGKNVVAVKANAFAGNKKITSVTIPETVTTIFTNAFKNCTGLKSVTISGSKLKTIHKQAFWQCTSLTSFTMPDSVQTLGDAVFEGCSKLKTVKLSSGLTKIPIKCFGECSSLTKITIPKGVINIEKSAFCNANKLETVTLEKGSKLVAIGDYAFSSCSSLKKMTVQGSTTTKDLKLPDTVSQIGGMAFNGTNFSTIIIPDKILKLNGSVFANCKKLEKVYYYGTNELSIVAQSFRDCTKLTNIYATICEVNDLAFLNCQNLEKLYVSSRLGMVGSGASTAFENCTKLKVYSKEKMAQVITAGAKENVVDTTAPKVKVTYSTTSPTKNDVTVTIESTDGHLLKPIAGWDIGAAYKTLTKTFTANTSTTVKVQDFVGNVTTTKVKVDNIDKTAPQITISNTTGTKWQNKPRMVTISANDKSGIKSLKVQKVGSNSEIKIGTTTGQISASKAGVELNEYGQYKVVAVDKAGNQKVSDTFWNYVDTDKPVITDVKADTSGKITAKVQDKTSKVVSVNLIGNGKTYQPKAPDANGNIEFNVAQTAKYTIKATDSAGNVKTEEVEVKVITQPTEEDKVEKNEEEDKTEPPDIEKPNEDATVKDDTVKEETSNGEEENGKKDEITTPGDQTSENPEQPEVPVETNQTVKFNYNETNKTVEIAKYVGTEDTLAIPETIEKDGKQYTITKIGKDAFKSTGVKKVEIPKTITQIEEGAFDNCQYLEKIIIKNENVNIADKAITTNKAGIKLYGKTGSTTENYAKANNIPFGIYIEEGNYEYIIVDETFQKVTNTLIEDGTLTTEEGEKADETNSDKVTNEEKIETIAEILRYNGNDESVLIPSVVGKYKVSSIGEEAFKGNASLKQVELPDNMRKIKVGAFEDCTTLNRVIIRNKEIEIGIDAFRNTSANLTLYCGYESAGMDYAKQKQIPYVLIHGAFMYELNEETKKATVLSARVGEGDPEYVTIEEDVGDYTLGGIKAGAFINTNLKGVIVKNRDVPIENVQLDPGALEGVEVGTLYCYKGSTADQYLKANSQLGIKVAYLEENGDVRPEEVTTEEKELNIKVGEEDSILAKIYPTITTNKELNYKSNDETVVTVDENGKIKGINEGETTIEVTSKADNSKVVTINIKVDFIKLTLKLNGGELNMKGNTYTDQLEIKVPYNYKMSDITNPTKYGYEFKGWYEEIEDDEDGKEDHYIEDAKEETITQDITLCAGWEEIKPQAGTNGDNTIADKILPNTGKATIMAISIVALIGTAVVTKIKIGKM